MAISGSRFLSACAGALVLALSPAVAASDASFDLVRLIRNEQANVKDAGGWAADILSGLADAGIPATRENVCSVVAVVSQESGFIANPQVKNLGVLAEKALRDKFGALLFEPIP